MIVTAIDTYTTRRLRVENDDPEMVAEAVRGFAADLVHIHLTLTPATCFDTLRALPNALPVIAECPSHAKVETPRRVVVDQAELEKRIAELLADLPWVVEPK